MQKYLQKFTILSVFVIILIMGNEVETLQQLLKEDPSNFQARRELALILADNGFNEEALTNLLYLKKYFPDDAELLYNIGILFEKQKKFEEAEQVYERAVELSPQADFNYNLGEVYVERQKWDNAIDCFKKVLSEDTNDGNSYFNLGLCYMKKEEINMAIDNFQKAIEINPDDIYALFHLGYIYQNNGLTNFAVENYRKILAIAPDYSWAYYNLAYIAYQNGNLEEAKENLLKTIEYNKNDIEAYKLLTKICIQQGEYEDIISLLNVRLGKEENGDLVYILAQVYKYTNQSEEYIVCLEQALKNLLTLTYPEDMVREEYKRADPDAEEKNIMSEQNEVFDEESDDEDEEDSEFDDEDEVSDEFDENDGSDEDDEDDENKDESEE